MIQESLGQNIKSLVPVNTPLLYEHQCLTDESVLIKNVHKVVLQGHDISMRTPKTGKCGIFLIKYMSDKLKHMLQEVTPDVINNTTSSILDFFFTTVTENTSLNYTNEVIDYNSTNSTDISNYDEQHSQDSTMLVSGLVLASAVSITYLLTCMYNKYCKKTPVAQTETAADINISDPTLIEINNRKAKIYYSDSSSADGTEYAIVDIVSKRATYTKATYDTSNPSSSHSDDHDRMELMSPSSSHSDDHDRMELMSPSSSHSDDHDRMELMSPSSSHSDDHDRMELMSSTDSSTQESSHVNSHRLAQLHIEDSDSGIPICDNCAPIYDYPQLPPRLATVYIPIVQHYDDSSILGLSEFLC
ncbi:hypothetical protein [Rickettsia massiliae]|uniref:Uncharacterized protein n=1 Tax=Rickettsia massiliae (strain Mtu5) TaxID=416276 RepID=A8F340_RICM5|nr:hypothetical protein [Rickettsia massiliae]ABV85326.1 Hypothetical protein RMA_p10 [Rickettsia massiliae MTU5]